MKQFIILYLSLLTLGCDSDASVINKQPLQQTNSLEGTGFTQNKLDSLSAFLKNNLETTAMMILVDGEVLFEYGDVDEVSYIASCRKSVLSILYGKYVENGTIKLDETIGSIGIEEEVGLSEIEKSATVDHIINSRSGVFLEPVNAGYDEANILQRGSVQPGSYFVYNNWDFNVAGAILEMKSGNSIYKELEEQLAIPLGFQDWDMEKQKKKFKKSKSNYPAYHMYLSTRDMAKIGQLMLNKGKWNGEQVISESWIRKITSPVTPVEVVNQRYGRDANSPYQFSYGYMWWLVDNFRQHPDFEGAYTASGWGGQFITVIPKRNMVVAHKYDVPTLVNWGLIQGGVGNYDYWELLYHILRSSGTEVISTQGS